MIPSAPTRRALDSDQRRKLYAVMLSCADRLIDGLNEDQTTCSECGLSKFNNRLEFLERRSLKKIIARLGELKEGKVQHDS